jgi:hypothetical protein
MRVLSLMSGLVLASLAPVSDARADWGAFYQGSDHGPGGYTQTDPEADTGLEGRALSRQMGAVTDRTGMHPPAQRRSLPRMTALRQGVAPAQPGLEPAMTGDVRGICLAHILRAQDRYGIPDNLLLGIGLQEAGVSRGGGLTVWPWAVNAAGEGRIFDNRAAALAWVRDRQAAGVRSIDVGCMQINLHWHPQAFADLEQGFDPAVNVDYAARFLLGLYAETGSWTRAAGAYHSRTPDRAEIYLTSLRRNVAVANDRIATFRALAGAGPALAGPDMLALQEPQADPVDHLQHDPWSGEYAEAAAPAPLAPWEHGYWSTGQDGSGMIYGLYSREPLEPILPTFLETF